jgi:integrase
MERHTILGGKVHIYRRPNSKKWHCAASLSGKEHRQSTRKEILDDAKMWAEEWYFSLLGLQRAGMLLGGPKFREAAELFEREYVILTRGERSPLHVENVSRRIRVHLVPYFGSVPVAAITPGLVQEYRMFRLQGGRGDPAAAEATPVAKPPARQTLEHEVTALRMVLATAHRQGWIAGVPDLSPPYRESSKVSHRGWFSPQEYRRLYMATRRRARRPVAPRWRHACEQLHDYILFMANTGLRPDEARRLQYRDVSVVRDADSGETILEIEVRGKRGFGWCKSTPGAVRPFQRLHKRNSPQATDRVFPSYQRQLFNKILDEEDLKLDRDGNRRTAYSLRHTYICLRLMEGADIYQIAKNCRTSVEMIEKHYAVHIKHVLNASEINVRRERPQQRFYVEEMDTDEDSAGVAA